MPTPLTLAAIEQRLEYVPSGQWESVEGGKVLVQGQELLDCGSWDLAEFVAHARTDIPALIARVRQLEAIAKKIYESDVFYVELPKAEVDAMDKELREAVGRCDQ